MSTKRRPQARHSWQPLRRAVPTRLTAEMTAQLLSRGATQALLDELDQAEMWLNDLYVVVVTRREDGSVCELSIRREDRRAVHDWRHFQRIKTELAGADAEAFEMYPAEDRLMDTANQYYLYVLPLGERIPAGYDGPRNVVGPGQLGTQRPLPEDWAS